MRPQSTVSLVFALTYLVLSGPVVVGEAAAQSTGNDEVRCSYSRRVACTSAGCNPIPVEDNYLLIPPLGDLVTASAVIRFGEEPIKIRRCDAKGCTPVSIASAASGAFLNLWKVEGGYLLKIVEVPVDISGLRRGEFVEVATAMLTTIVSYGRCPLPD
jgi:hypothetical protein